MMDQKIDMKRGSLGLADVNNSTTNINIDVMATVRTHGDDEYQNKSAFLPIIDLRNSKDNAELSMHDKKEAEIYHAI